MKTAHIVHLSTYPPDDGRLFQKACKAEVAEGFRVTQIVCHDRDETVAGVTIVAVPKPKGRLLSMTSLPWKMYRHAMRRTADIYVLQHPDMIPAGLLLKLAGKKVIYEPRECYADKIPTMRWIPEPLRPFARAAFARYERMTSALWDHVIVTDRHSAKTFAGRTVSVVPNYPLLIPVKHAPANPNGKRVLLYVGGLCDERGLGVMLKIAESLQNCNVELQLMGPCPYPGDEARIRKAPNVKYFGNQSLEAVYQRMATADLGLLLLQPVPAYTYAGENTLKLFEYMWSSLPLVSSDFPNLRRIIGAAQCGICIDPCDAEQAAEAIMDLLGQPDVCKRMGANGHRAVEEAYNWPAAWEVLRQVYANVLSGNRSSVPTPPLWDGEPADAVSCGTGSAA
jgi:glycosyltransferase involved in cell wall biosynthesis